MSKNITEKTIDQIIDEFTLMHDFQCTRADEMVYNELAEAVRHFKETEEGRSSVCKSVKQYAKQEAKKAAETARLAGEKATEAARLAGEKATEAKRLDTLFEDLNNVVKEIGISIERAMDVLKVSESDRAILMERF